MNLSGKIALVTGASRGIGAATAILLAQNGAAVAVNYVSNKQAAASVVEEITTSGGRAIAVQADMTVAAEAQGAIDQTEADLGPIDILVINAGLRFRVAPFLEYSWEDFEAKYVGELKAAFFAVKAVAQKMVSRGSGSIIAVSSSLSKHPGEGFVAHSSSKSALNAFVRALALELGPYGVRVNTVAPGLTITDATAFLPDDFKQATAAQTPLRSNALPEDVAKTILFLASDSSNFITGGYLPVDGGNTML